MGKCTISAGSSLYVQNNNTNVTPLVAGLVSMTVNNFSSVAHLQNIQRTLVGKTELRWPTRQYLKKEKLLTGSFIAAPK